MIDRIFQLLKWITFFGLTCFCLLLAYAYFIIAPSLPSPSSLKDVQYQVPLSIYSQDNKLIAQFGEKKRTPILYEQIPSTQIQAFLAAEDSRFFSHGGVDYVGMSRAIIQLIITGEKRQGASTITMQVARNFFLTRKKTYTRKLREIVLSYLIEHDLSKEQILTLYLNKIYLGHRSYGIAAAANVYYGKPLVELSLAQQAMIAGLPKAPSAYNPITNPSRAKLRRDHILRQMLSLNFITEEQYKIAVIEPVSAEINNSSTEVSAPYLAEMVRETLYQQYAESTYTSGMRVYTTINSQLQKAANRALRKALHDYDKRHGYRGTLGHIKDLPSTEQTAHQLLSDYKSLGEIQPALVSSVSEQSISVATRNDNSISINWPGLKWAWPFINENRQGKQPTTAADIVSVGDIIYIRKVTGTENHELAQIPTVSGSLTAIHPENGALAALVGGYDYYHSKFNRATQAQRQHGSGFKPFLYTAALAKNYTTATLINDAPVVFNDAGLEQQWRPENYSGKFFGPTRLREALTHSRNLVSIRILRDIGINYTRKFASSFGFDPATLPRNLSLALGSGSTNTYQMAAAYSTFANGGYKIEPYFIDRIESYEGDILFQANPAIACSPCQPLVGSKPVPVNTSSEESIPEPTIDALNSTFQRQNEKALTPIIEAEQIISPPINFLINSLLRNVVKHGTGRRALSLGRSDLAGKTGTTNEQRDAWFSGYSPSMVAIAWLGFDNSQPLGNRETGGKAALPMWIDFMREALKDSPQKPFSQPDGIVSILIDPLTGLRSDASNPNAIFEYFREQNTPENSNPAGSLNTLTSDQQLEIDELF